MHPPGSILTMCLSAHRYYPIGSENEVISNKGMEIMQKAIRFSVDTGIRIIQLAGYDVFSEKSTVHTQQKFLENLAKSVEWAGANGVTLAIETMDTDFIDSVSKAMKFVKKINSPWLQLYPDFGNMTAYNQDTNDLLNGLGHIVAVHVKDTMPGVIRRIPYGEGTVNFIKAFRLLHQMNFKGPLLMEMWTDDAENAVEIIANAREWVLRKWNETLELEVLKKDVSA